MVNALRPTANLALNAGPCLQTLVKRHYKLRASGIKADRSSRNSIGHARARSHAPNSRRTPSEFFIVTLDTRLANSYRGKYLR